MPTRLLIDHRAGGVVHSTGAAPAVRQPEKVNRPATQALRTPDWIRVRAPRPPT